MTRFIVSLFLLGAFTGPLAAAEKANGEVDLLAGPLDAAGPLAWKHFSEDPKARLADVWQLRDGVLVCRGAPKGYLYLDRGFADFVLKLQWRWPEGKQPGSGGVLVRITGTDKIWPRSLEAQLNAGQAGDFWGIGGFALDGPADRMKTLEDPKLGRLTHLKRTANLENPAGQWNEYEIIARGDTVTLRINGKEVNRATRCDGKPGRICLTAEGSEIHFRNVKLQSLDQAAAASADALNADMSYFTDASCSQLKTSVRPENLAGFKSDLLKSVASGMLDGKYDKIYRAASYEAYPSPRELGRTLKLGDGFSRYENITGIYLEAGEHVVFVGNTGGRQISLLIPDWMRKPAEGINPTKDPNGWGLHKQVIELKEGVNVIQVRNSGNAYVSYFDDHAEQAPKVSVHFPTGKVNGFFDATKNTNADWNRLLDQAVSPIMDARGKHIQVAYPVEWFNVYTRGKGTELINNYDAMLNHHYSLMGLVKYKKVPRNRILARVNFNYYMFRDGDGVAYLGNKSTMRMVADPSVVIAGDPCWGFCHEVGHALQMRQMTWGGMTEVSNNIFSMYTVCKMGNASRIKAQKNYASARKTIIEANPRKSLLDGTDVFDRLVPFWQLHLYFSRNGRPDFYADVMEQMRLRPNAGSGDDSIRNQFEFVKICCDVAELDLTDFFEKWGFFWVGELTLNDYRKYHYTITQQVVDDAKSYIAKKQYKSPAVDITTIED
ncbi:MAG: M60 family metallopeptidase [Planctomycetota bacterium]|nr:M60 family metallopeptidase [Planctomycetota bacterium]